MSSLIVAANIMANRVVSLKVPDTSMKVSDFLDLN